MDPPGRQEEEEKEQKPTQQHQDAAGKEERMLVTARQVRSTTRTGPAFKDQMREVISATSVLAEEMHELRAFDHLPVAEAVEIFETAAAIPREFLCPISGKMLQDPVLLLPSGITYDKKFLCQELLREPNVDPFSQQRYKEKLRYCDNRLVQKLLIQKLGQSAYRPYKDDGFQSRYDQIWSSRNRVSLELGTNIKLYQRVEALMFGLNRTRIDMETAFALVKESSANQEDPIIAAYHAWFVEPDTVNFAIFCPKDKVLADKLWTRAAHLGLTELAERGGNPFAESMEGRRRFLHLKKGAMACYWFEKAAEKSDHAASQWSLSNLYRTGGEGFLEDPVEKNVDKAIYFCEKAAAKGHASSQTNMGIMHFQGYGHIEQNDAVAFSYFRKAAEQGDDFAQFNLAWMYQHGQGVAKDAHAASFWYGRAADQGHAQAREILGRSPTSSVRWD